MQFFCGIKNGKDIHKKPSFLHIEQYYIGKVYSSNKTRSYYFLRRHGT